MNKEMTQLIRELRHKGWTATHTKKHWKLKGPDGHMIVHSSTPSDYRSMSNLKAMIKRPPKRIERKPRVH